EASGTITWPLGTIPAGTSGRLRFSVTVDEPATDGTAIVAEADITGTGERATATQSTSVASIESLSIHATANPDALAQNTRAIYDVTICNSAAFDATGVKVDALIPNGLAFAVAIDATCSSGACGAGSLLSWDVGTLEAGRCRVLPLSEDATAANAGE